MSRPSRGAWIENFDVQLPPDALKCRAPHGARGLKRKTDLNGSGSYPVAPPHGARGLKLST